MGKTIPNLNKQYIPYLKEEYRNADWKESIKAIAGYLCYLEKIRSSSKGNNKPEYIYVSQSKIKEKLNISIPTIIKVIGILISIGLISKKKRPVPDSGSCNKYYINQDFVEENPVLVEEEEPSEDSIFQEIEVLKAQNEELKKQNEHIIWMLNQLMVHKPSKMERIY